MMPGNISTYIIDLATGRPAVGVQVRLGRQDQGRWRSVARAVSGADGRIAPDEKGEWRVDSGLYCLTYDTTAYFAELGQMSSFLEIVITFAVSDHCPPGDFALFVTPHAYMVCRDATPIPSFA
jgi:5-hydroxyisourate hydrolase